MRNIERRIKARAGLSLRSLLRLRRAEQSFFAADQAHLSRDVRGITGHSPGKFLRLLASDDESYWIYRIWL